MNYAFDTLSALRSLEASGLDSRHAEAIVQVVSDNHLQLATKADSAALKDEFQAFREEICKQFTKRAEETENRFTSFTDEMENRFTSFTQEMENRFTSFTEKMEDRFTALTETMENRFTTSRKETGAQFSAWRKEHESSLATLAQQFRVELWRVVNRMLLAQVAVGALVVAVLSML